MAKLSRVFQKLFGTDGTVSYFGKFGSKAASAPVNTKDPATIQALQAFLDGWESAIISGSKPALEDMNSLFLLVFYQLAYLMQAGIPEYDSSTYYYTGSYCQVSGVIYQSLTDDNVGNAPASSPTDWQLLQFVRLTGAETVAGVKTFSSSPIVPTPTTNYQVATKEYADKAILSSIKDYGTSASSGTSKDQKDLKVCFGSISISGSGSQAITNLPFSSTSSYKLVACFSSHQSAAESVEVVQNSASQATIYNNDNLTQTINWIATGT